jgi:hypothetical protein
MKIHVHMHSYSPGITLYLQQAIYWKIALYDQSQIHPWSFLHWNILRFFETLCTPKAASRSSWNLQDLIAFVRTPGTPNLVTIPMKLKLDKKPWAIAHGFLPFLVKKFISVLMV